MATTPSQTPVASELPQDLKFNAGKIDEFVTSLALQYIDRFGGAHYTIEGLKQLVLQQIYNLGWNPVGTFQDGATLTGAGDILQDESTGVWYRWDDLATLPKTVPAGSTPDSTGGTGEGKWLAVDVNDVLRKELAEPTGAELVGAVDSDGNETTVQEAMNHYRGYTIKERLDEHLSVKAFGAKGDGITDDTAAFQSCINWCIANNAEIYVPGGDYLIKSTLVFTAGVTMRGKGVSAYTNKTIIRAGTAGMLLCDFQSAENYLVDLLFFGFEPIDVDAVNGYGQGATCNGLRFLRSNGAKDIDSVLRNVIVVSFVTGVSATGANLAIKGFGATACRFPIDLKAATVSPDDFRGFVFDDLRFHKCGGNTTTTDSVCIKATGTLKNIMFTNLFADSGCHSLFYGALAEGATINGVVVRQMDGDCITVVNTGITPSAAYQTYKVTNISYQTPGSTVVNGGWCVILRDAPGGLITDINTAFTKKGVISADNSPDLVIDDINARNINTGFATDGAIYDGVQLGNNSVNCSVTNVKIRNSLGASQARSALFVDSTSLAHVRNISASNVVKVFDGTGHIRGEKYEASSAPTTSYGTAIPVAADGTFAAGSIRWNTSPTSGGVPGWFCITTGTPGAWRAMAAVASL